MITDLRLHNQLKLEKEHVIDEERTFIEESGDVKFSIEMNAQSSRRIIDSKVEISPALGFFGLEKFGVVLSDKGKFQEISSFPVYELPAVHMAAPSLVKTNSASDTVASTSILFPEQPQRHARENSITSVANYSHAFLFDTDSKQASPKTATPTGSLDITHVPSPLSGFPKPTLEDRNFELVTNFSVAESLSSSWSGDQIATGKTSEGLPVAVQGTTASAEFSWRNLKSNGDLTDASPGYAVERYSNLENSAVRYMGFSNIFKEVLNSPEPDIGAPKYRNRPLEQVNEIRPAQPSDAKLSSGDTNEQISCSASASGVDKEPLFMSIEASNKLMNKTVLHPFEAVGTSNATVFSPNTPMQVDARFNAIEQSVRQALHSLLASPKMVADASEFDRETRLVSPDKSGISVLVDVDRMDIRFLAERRDAADLLSRHQHQLQEELRRSGVDGFSFSFGSDENNKEHLRHRPTETVDGVSPIIHVDGGDPNHGENGFSASGIDLRL
ncbi:flagellar hook-length control protein FliK [Marivita hallyeonensis]|uniref:Hook-length control protein FliK n=1 Tax=Marivita hallyeonensis TaxID=996342 RepID=A0A1M5ULD4_9RHOB|nr:flagellar hook-length control protein FliK [Marivita hallyeonensis]SHH63814.1 hypothetical protein SAMN05443551_2698 [Marivita hallyeonensis]